MPFENEAKTPFKYLTVAEKVEIIDTLAGKYDDRELLCYDSIGWKKLLNNLDRIFLDCPYKVVQKDIIVAIRPTNIDNGTITYHFTCDKPLPNCKYKLVKIED